MNGGIISEQNSRVWSKGIRKIVDEGREEGGAKNRALGKTIGREANRRVRVRNPSDVAAISEIYMTETSR